MNNSYKNMRDIVEISACKFKNNKAFIIKEKGENGVSYDNITYSRLNEEIKALGKYMLNIGLKGKKIAVIGKNSYQWMLSFLSVLCIDSIVVPLDKGLLDYEIKDQLSRSGADAIFYSSEQEELIKDVDNIIKICTDFPQFKSIIDEGRNLSNDDEYEKIVPDEEKNSILLFTSGTTSKSKAVMLSQKNIISDVNGLRDWETFYSTDVNMAILPFHHSLGMTQIILFLSYGICNVFCEGLRVDKCLKEYGVTIMVAVPRIIEEIYNSIQKLLKKKNLDSKINKIMVFTNILKRVKIDIRRRVFKAIIDGLGGQLRLIIVGAAAANPEILNWFNNIGILTIQGYGLTETSPVLSAENDKFMRTGSVGKALPNAKVKIFEPDENGIGEIIAQGDMVMLGYYNDEKTTQEVIFDGYFHTGDIGYIDKDGYIFISGRKKNVIVLDNGKNVFPEEIESILSDCSYICVILWAWLRW